MDREREIDELISAGRGGRLTRRDLIRKALALGLGVPTIAILIEACGSSSSSVQSSAASSAASTTSSSAAATGTTAPSASATASSAAASGSPTSSVSNTAAGSPPTGSLSFDAGTTGGGGGLANTPLIDYCYVVSGGSMFAVRRSIDSRLFAWKPDLSGYIAELAENWDVDQSNLTITFHLRQNAKWHDGQPVTADDVLFTFNLIANPATGSRYTNAFASTKGFSDVASGKAKTLSGLTAPDPHTVILQLDKIDAGVLPQLPDIDILPKHVIGSTEPSQICEVSYWVQNPIGAGPYKWSQKVDEQQIELEAFTDYFLGSPKIAKINLLLFANPETSIAAFAKQSSYAAPLSVSDLSYAKSLSFGEIQTQSSGVLMLEVNSYNKSVPQFADKRVRQAMSYAIDRKSIASQLYKSVSAVPTNRTTPWLDWTDSPSLISYDYDPDKAKSLLKAANWTSSTEYTLWYYYTDQVTASVVQAIQQYLGAVSIKVKPRLNEGGAMDADEKNNTWELVYGAWGLSPAFDMDQVFNCTATLKYCNPQFAKLMQQSRATFDVSQQQNLLKQAVAILNEDLPAIWLFNRNNITLTNTRLDTGGHQAWATGSLSYHNYIEDWSIKA